MGVADESLPYRTLRNKGPWGSSHAPFLKGLPASESPGVMVKKADS